MFQRDPTRLIYTVFIPGQASLANKWQNESVHWNTLCNGWKLLNCVALEPLVNLGCCSQIYETHNYNYMHILSEKQLLIRVAFLIGSMTRSNSHSLSTRFHLKTYLPTQNIIAFDDLPKSKSQANLEKINPYHFSDRENPHHFLDRAINLKYFFFNERSGSQLSISNLLINLNQQGNNRYSLWIACIAETSKGIGFWIGGKILFILHVAKKVSK